MGKEQTPPPSAAEKSKSNRPSAPPSSHHGGSAHSPAKPPSTKEKNKTSKQPTPSSHYHSNQQKPKHSEKKAAMSIRITKNSQPKAQSAAGAGGGSRIGTCSKTGLILVTASMPDVGIVPPPSDERNPQFCCVWPTETDCDLLIEDTTINGVSCQVLKNATVGGKEDRELNCLVLPLLPAELQKQQKGCKVLPASIQIGSQSMEQLLAKLDSHIFDSRGSGRTAPAADQHARQSTGQQPSPSPPSSTPAAAPQSTFKRASDKSASSKAASPVKPRQFVKATVTRSKPTPTLASATEPKSGASASTSMATTYSKFSQFAFVSSPGSTVQQGPGANGGGGGSFLESKVSTFSQFSQYSTATSPGVNFFQASKASNCSKFSPFSVSDAAGSFASSKATTYSKFEQPKSFKKKTPQSPCVKSPSGQSKRSDKSNSSKKA